MGRFGLVGLLAAGVVCVGLLSSCNDRPPTRMATQESAPVVTPTAAPTVTATPVPLSMPTPTPRLTLTPTPTETPRPASMSEPTPTSSPTSASIPELAPTPEPTSEFAPLTPTPTPESTSTPMPAPDFREEAETDLSEILWWFSQPGQESERDAVEMLIDLWLVDIGLAGQIARLPWVSNGIEPFELKALQGLLTTAKVDQALTHRMLRFSWIFAQLTEEEEDAIGSIASIASRTPSWPGRWRTCSGFQTG